MAKLKDSLEKARSKIKGWFRDRKHETILAKFEEVLLGQAFIKEDLRNIKQQGKDMANTVAELEGVLETVQTGLTDVGAKLTEGLGEVTEEIAKLREQLNTVQLPAGAQARLDDIVARTTALQATAKTLADIVPNPPAPEA